MKKIKIYRVNFTENRREELFIMDLISEDLVKIFPELVKDGVTKTELYLFISIYVYDCPITAGGVGKVKIMTKNQLGSDHGFTTVELLKRSGRSRALIERSWKICTVEIGAEEVLDWLVCSPAVSFPTTKDKLGLARVLRREKRRGN